MSKEVEFLKRLAKKSAKLISKDINVYSKDEKGDLVTNFDYEIEKYIINEIKKKYPKFEIISEEFNSKEKLSQNCFTIDPIDGTINFANGLPLWGIQLACVKDWKTCASVIYLPCFKELYWADESGAYLNKKRIHVNDKGINNGIYIVEGGNTLKDLNVLYNQNKQFRRVYCVAVAYSWIARGLISGLKFNKITLWDYVPGEFLVKMAGGKIIDLDLSRIAANTKEFATFLSYNKS